jgi:hypothetical protein
MAERIEFSFGLSGFLDVLFLFVSRKFPQKRSEVGFLENHTAAFSALINREKFLFEQPSVI